MHHTFTSNINQTILLNTNGRSRSLDRPLPMNRVPRALITPGCIPIWPRWAHYHGVAHVGVKIIPMNLIWSESARWLLSYGVRNVPGRAFITPVGTPMWHRWANDHNVAHIQLKKVPAPHSPPKRIPRSYISLENTPFSRILDEKKNLFNGNRRFWGLIKHPFFKQSAILFSLYTIKYPFCESEINCIKMFTVYIVFFITSNLKRVFKYSSEV